MINKTIGNGGNFATIGDAIAALNAASPLTDDYTFTLISDVAEEWHVSSNYDANGKTVTFTAAPHGGRLASAKKVTFAHTVYNNGLDFSIANGNLIVENIHIYRTDLDYAIPTVYLRVYDSGSIILRKCFIYIGVGHGVIAEGNVGSTKVYGCLLYGTIYGGNCAVMIGNQSNAVVENVTIFRCDNGVYDGSDNNSAVLRNVVTLDCTTGWNFVGNPGGKAALINCADSGTSINDSSHRTKCLSGIDTVSNVHSIIPTDPLFMVPKIQF